MNDASGGHTTGGAGGTSDHAPPQPDVRLPGPPPTEPREPPVGPDADVAPPRHRRKRKKDRPLQHLSREHRRRRLRRHGRRAYVRSVYFLPSLATLGNAICGFGSLYVASLDHGDTASPDAWTRFFAANNFLAAAYLIFAAMVCDALDGRLARYTRHTTDFGGQLDSLADVISFGLAPAFLALQLFKTEHPDGLLPVVTRLIWAIGALYVSCAAMRLARFNVSNEHGEQAHFSFLGLPSPGAGGAVAGLVLLQQELRHDPWHGHLSNLGNALASSCTWFLPVLVLVTGLLMISTIRYGHVVNRYLRGKRPYAKLIAVVAGILLFIIAHRYVIAIGTISYALAGLFNYLWLRIRRQYVAAPG